VWEVTDQIQELVRSGEPLDRDRLADPDVPLDELKPTSGSGRATSEEGR
jgi:hypothetical protein